MNWIKILENIREGKYFKNYYYYFNYYFLISTSEHQSFIEHFKDILMVKKKERVKEPEIKLPKPTLTASIKASWTSWTMCLASPQTYIFAPDLMQLEISLACSLMLSCTYLGAESSVEWSRECETTKCCSVPLFTNLLSSSLKILNSHHKLLIQTCTKKLIKKLQKKKIYLNIGFKEQVASRTKYK